MRKFKEENFHDIDEGDIIAFDRTNKKGETVSHLAFVRNVKLTDDEDYVTEIEVLLMAPSDVPVGIKKKSIEAHKPNMLETTGLGTPHKIYAIGVKLPADRFQDDILYKLGAFKKASTDAIIAFSKRTETEDPNAFGIEPKKLLGFTFPKITIEIEDPVVVEAKIEAPTTKSEAQTLPQQLSKAAMPETFAEEPKEKPEPAPSAPYKPQYEKSTSSGHSTIDAWGLQGEDNLNLKSLLLVGPGR